MSSLPTISTLRAPRAQYIADRIRRTTLYDLNRARFVGLETEKLEDWIHILPLATVLALLSRVNLT
jgi:hypothetical protein